MDYNLPPYAEAFDTQRIFHTQSRKTWNHTPYLEGMERNSFCKSRQDLKGRCKKTGQFCGVFTVEFALSLKQQLLRKNDTGAYHSLHVILREVNFYFLPVLK